MKKGTSILFVNSRNQIILFLRDDNPNIPYQNCWDVPGGNVEEGETPEQCIIREMREEIGRDIEKLQFYKMYNMGDRIEYTYWEKVDFDIEKITLTEGVRLKWFTEDDIKKGLDKEIAFNFKKIIIEFFKEAPFKKIG